jgi:hypothetical protein
MCLTQYTMSDVKGSVLNLTDFTRTDLEMLVTPQVLERGLFYHQEGRLIRACRLTDCLAGQVTDERGLYQVRLWIEAGMAHGECDCSYPGFCKHLVALALAWLERRERFYDLQKDLEKILGDPAESARTLKRLALKDPLNFWEISRNVPLESAEFRNNRALIELVARLFDRTALTKPDADFLWERLNQARQCLAAQLPKGASELLSPLADLLTGALREYRNFRNDLLHNYLEELLRLLRKLPQFYGSEALEPLLAIVGAAYFQPDLWELAPESRQVLVAFLTQNPAGLRQCRAARETGPAGLLTLIAWYELLTALPVACRAEVQSAIQRAEQELRAMPDGRLWLIDRWLESDPDAAEKLIGAAMKQAGAGERPVFRERLIRLRLLKGEIRQAAALSFIQFTEAPEFEEYLRLKFCLERWRPADWLGYLQRMRQFLVERGERELWLRIAVDQNEAGAISKFQDEIIANPLLLANLVKLLNERPAPVLAPVYPAVIRALATQDNAAHGNLVRQTMGTFKKLCLQNHFDAQWEQFRLTLPEQLPAGSGWLKRLGALLSS